MTDTLPRSTPPAFVVPRATGAHGDILAAVGLADLLADQVGANEVRLVGDAKAIEVRPPGPLDNSCTDRLAVRPGYDFLKANKKTAVPSAVTRTFDYEQERARVDRYREAQKALRQKRGLTPDQEQAIREDAPRDEWRQVQVMNMLSAHLTANDLHATIAALAPDEARRAVAGALDALADGRTSGLGWKANSVQLFNPTSAKGYARLKPDGTDRNDKTKEAWTDPFVEWLRIRGYFRVACPFFLGSKGEHIRLYAPIPADASLATVAAAARRLRSDELWGDGAKLDALAVLTLAEFLIRGSREGHSQDDGADLGFSLVGMSPAEVIGGIAITHYQSLGSARAVASISTLAVPGWFPISAPEDARDWLEILDEHRRVLRGLRDDHSDEIGLLLAYRRFLERRGRAALLAFLDFMGAYGPFLIRAREAGRRVRGFRTRTFRRLVESMSDAGPLASILADPGFEAVARAVRRATVSAQWQKANKSPRPREIRYDLLPELRRARNLPQAESFTVVVADFVAKYNAENARRREMDKPNDRWPTPANVSTAELKSFVDLVDRNGANLVGALLCAYGTCTERRDDGPTAEDEAGGSDAGEPAAINATEE